MSNQNGPTLTLVATCAGCEHLCYRPERDGLTELRCARADLRIALVRTPQPLTTPAWCPLIAAARLAFARATLAKEGET